MEFFCHGRMCGKNTCNQAVWAQEYAFYSMWPEWVPHPEHKNDSVVHQNDLRSFRPFPLLQQGQKQDEKGKAYRQPQHGPLR